VGAIADALPTHGGLTPAALVGVRVHTRDRAIYAEHTSRTKSGWREPAVAREATVRCETQSVRKKPIAVTSANPTHGGLTPAALVHVRSSIANVAFARRTHVVHQERLA
jgi:hypothetical protein